MAELIRILIADDHPLFRDGVAHSLADELGFEIVGQAGSGEEAFKLAAELRPDVLLLDISMPGQGGIVTAAKIAVAYPSIHIMMLTVLEDEENLLEALKAGANGYVLKGISAEALVLAVRAVAAGEVHITSKLAGSILFELTRDQPSDPLEVLTPRECEVLELVVQGLMNREIAAELSLAEKTIKHYMSSILQKLQVRTRVEAALLAQRRGLGDSPEDKLAVRN